MGKRSTETGNELMRLLYQQTGTRGTTITEIFVRPSMPFEQKLLPPAHRLELNSRALSFPAPLISAIYLITVSLC